MSIFAKWMYLPEALKFVLAYGVSEADARSSVPRACRNGEVRARGRSQIYFDHGGQNPLLPDVWDQADVDWKRSAILTFGRYARTNKAEISDVELSRDDLQRWLRESQISSAAPIAKPVYRSPYVELILAAEAHFGTRLDGSGSYAKKQEIEDWLRDHWGEFISVPLSQNLVRSMGTLIRDPALTKGGNRRAK